MVSKKPLSWFTFHIVPRVMNNFGYMYLFGFSRGPLLFSRRGPPFVFIQLPYRGYSLHYLGCFLQSSTCHEQFWMCFFLYRGFSLQRIFYIFIEESLHLASYFLLGYFASIILFILLCVQEEATFAFLSSQVQDWIEVSTFLASHRGDVLYWSIVPFFVLLQARRRFV